jgi:hypothetical protein
MHAVGGVKRKCGATGGSRVQVNGVRASVAVGDSNSDAAHAERRQSTLSNSAMWKSFRAKFDRGDNKRGGANYAGRFQMSNIVGRARMRRRAPNSACIHGAKLNTQKSSQPCSDVKPSSTSQSPGNDADNRQLTNLPNNSTMNAL